MGDAAQGQLDENAIAGEQKRRPLHEFPSRPIIVGERRLDGSGPFQYPILDKSHGCFPQHKPVVQYSLNESEG
jgi:hypothetical protein